MKRPIVSKKSLDLQSNHFLRRSPGYPLGISLGELDYLRGHNDDFFGDLLLDEYTTEIAGANSIVATLWNNAHGGWANLQSGNAAGRYSRLWLGDAADGYATLDSGQGWIMIGRRAVSSTADGDSTFGTLDAATNNIILAGMLAAQANWSIITRTGGGAFNIVAGTIAKDTDWHWHVMDVYPITGGSQIDYYLDGTLTASTNAQMPTGTELTPLLYQYSTAANIRTTDWDYWAVIPRNL